MTKTILAGILLSFIVSSAFAQKKQSSISFEKKEVSLGKLKKDDVVNYTFQYTNSGNVPLIISEVIASCGCTVVDFSKEPLKPSKKGTLKIAYHAATKGPFHKTITVNSNTNQPVTTLILTGEVN